MSSSAALRSFEALWRARTPDPLATLRGEAMRRVVADGLPTTRDESWRYTNLRMLSAQSFDDAPAPAADAAARVLSLSSLAGAGCAPSIAIVNGYPVLGDRQNQEGFADGSMEITNLRTLAARDAEALMRRFAASADSDRRRWALLNTALFIDGLHVKIKGAAAPLLIVHMSEAGRPNTAAHSRVIIDLEPGASATIIEHHIAGGEHGVLCNSAAEIALAPGAAIEHYRVFATMNSTTHFDTLDVRMAKDSRCREYTIAIGGGLVRATLEAHLDEPGAALDSQTLLAGTDARHVDCVNTAIHAARMTTSRQTARAIAGGTSRVIFNSKVIVNEGAAGADSRQSSRGLLLAPTAEIDTRPQLQIHADEVKCAHGATVGRLDPDMLFYLLSRGLDRATAQSLLVFAFLDDVLTGMSSAPARHAIETALIALLPDAELLRAFR